MKQLGFKNLGIDANKGKYHNKLQENYKLQELVANYELGPI